MMCTDESFKDIFIFHGLISE